MTNHLPAFSIHDLAQISDWLTETGEAVVDVYPLHAGGGSLQFLIRSMQDLRLIVLQEGRW